MHYVLNALLGLFHKAISQSGSAIKPWSFVSKPAEQARLFGEKLQCPTNDSISLVRCLKGLDSTSIVMAHWDYLVSFVFDSNRKYRYDDYLQISWSWEALPKIEIIFLPTENYA